MGKGLEQTFLQRRPTNGQHVYEKMLTITNDQKNTHQNHSEISPHTCQNGYYLKKKKKRGGMDAVILEPSCFVGGGGYKIAQLLWKTGSSKK